MWLGHHSTAESCSYGSFIPRHLGGGGGLYTAIDVDKFVLLRMDGILHTQC